MKPSSSSCSRKACALAAVLVLGLLGSLAAAAPATCKISIQGSGEENDGVKSATIACSGSRLRMGLGSGRLAKFTNQFKGVVLDKANCGDLDCLVTFCGNSVVTIVESSIQDVVAIESEGMLCAAGSSKVLVSNGVFAGNHAQNGSLHVRGTAAMTVVNSDVSHNTGVRGGGAQVNGEGTLTIINSTWNHNTGEFGGGVNVRDSGILRVTNHSIFDCNYAYSDLDSPAGAALYCRDAGSVYVQNHCIFNNNLVEGYDSAGGALFLQDDCTLELVNGNVFRNNSCLEDNAAGGAICASNNVAVSITGNNSFVENVASGDNCGGGALFARDDVVLAVSNGASFVDNQAIGDVGQGGAIYLSNQAKAVVSTDIMFKGNTASGVNSQGGAINGRQNADLVIKDNVMFVNNGASCGGGIALVGDMSCNISDTAMTGHEVLGAGGAMYAEGSFTMRLHDCKITNNRAAEGGGMVASASTASATSRFQLTISGNTDIINNSASTGGGISLVSGATTIGAGVVIAHNHAAQGGGVYVVQGCPTCSATCDLNPEANIENNTAVVAGGGIYLDSSAVKINEGTARAVAQGNTAAFGPDLSLVSDCVPGEVMTGAWCQQCGVNLYSFNPSNASCDICPSDATCSGSTDITPRPGYWHSAPWSIQMHHCPNPEACSQAGLGTLSSSSSTTSTSGRRSSSSSVVQLGSNTQVQTAGGAAQGAGSWATDTAAAGRRLLQGTTTSANGNHVQQLVVADFPGVAASSGSRSPKLPFSSDMNWQCAEGYAGHLCGSCTQGHNHRAPFRCSKCLAHSVTVALLVIAFIVLVVLILVMSHVTWLDGGDAQTDIKISDILKVVIVYVQCLMILANTSINWPSCIAAVFTALTWLFSAGNSQLLSIDCLLQTAQLEVPVAVLRQLVYLTAPLVMFVAVVSMQAFLQAVHWLFTLHKGCQQPLWQTAVRLWDRVPVIAIVTLLFFYPGLVRAALSFFACYPVDSQSGLYAQYAVADAACGYWQYDMWQACWQGWHQKWALGLGVPFTLLLCGGVPTGILVLLWLSRNRLDEFQFRRHYGVLYRLYKCHCFCWEAVVAFQLVLLVLISVFGPNVGPWHEIILLNLVFIVMLFVQLMFKPYKFGRLHNIAVFASLCLNATAYAALSFAAAASRDVELVYKEVVGAVVLALHLAFILWAAYCVAVLVKQLFTRLQQRRTAARLSQRRRGPKESKRGSIVHPPLSNAETAALAGVLAGVAAGKAVAQQYRDGVPVS